MENKTELYTKKLTQMINVETISIFQVETLEKYEQFQNTLKELFPNVFSNFKLELFHGSMLLSYIVDNDLEPILLMSHQDVVEPNGIWKHDPFNAVVEDGKLYGRGTLDTKGNLFAIFESLEELFEEGYEFKRSIYIESACNEETTQDGSKEVFDELRRRGVHFYFTLDEGGMIVPNPFGGRNDNIAMVALGEKVPVDLKISIKGCGGHASTPSKTQPLVVLSRFMNEMSCYKGFKTKLEKTNLYSLQTVSNTQKGLNKFLFKHSFFFAPLLKGVFKRMSAETHALVETTVCFTRIQGSNGNNVIPETAYVIANMRVSHYEGIESAINKVTKIASKYGLEVEVIDQGNPSSICSYDTEQFKYLTKCVDAIYPGVKTCPYIANGASDSQNLEGLSENIFRFAPFIVSTEQLQTIHGIDENVDISSLEPAVKFFKYVVENL